MSQITRVLVTVAVALTVLVGVVPSHAQFVGGGAPAGAPYQMYSVTGVAEGGGLSTVFTCTNAGEVTAAIAVQLFDQNGAAQNNSPALSVPPGGTAQFATLPVVPFSPDQLLFPVNVFSKGSAKIWANTKKVICSALLANSANGMASLPVISKVKQKGD